MQRGDDGAAVEIARRSKAQAISGTARGQTSPSAPAKENLSALAGRFFYKQITYARHAQRAAREQTSPSASAEKPFTRQAVIAFSFKIE
ncbi:MAG: hypothetical protein IKR49_08395 [Clostridia bacterium]|nr:hypothetical protein [Clostridia bacterium]